MEQNFKREANKSVIEFPKRLKEYEWCCNGVTVISSLLLDNCISTEIVEMLRKSALRVI